MVRVWTFPVDADCTVTTAPDTTAPVLSVMVPIILPLAVWAAATCGNSRANANEQAASRHRRRTGMLYLAACGKRQPARPRTAGSEFLELGILAKHYDR